MSDKPIADAIAKFQIPDVPAETVTIGVEAQSGQDATVIVAANKDIGKPGGWTVGASGSWAVRAKSYAAQVWAQWTGK